MKVEEKVKKYIGKIKKENGKINAFLHLNQNAVEEAKQVDAKGKKGRLYGYVIAVKSNICVKGLECNCASKVLEGWKSPYNASVIEKIKAEDGVIIGMTNCDEFGCGSSGENSAFGVTQNPCAMGRIPGGSSSGSAAAVSAGFCDVSLGTDTGGSIRNPASHCGVVGIKPSYGLVSRYGLIDLGMSLDTIGVIAKNVDDAVLVLDVIKGKDEKDTMSFASEEIKLGDVGKIKVGVVRVKGVDKRIQELIDKKINEVCEKNKWKSEEVEIKYIDLAVGTYYLLVYAELFSASRRFDGRRYGKKFEEFCGEEVLRRVLGGSEITKAEFAGDYYKKALKVKELIGKEFERVFQKVDCIVMPVVPSLPWEIGKGKEMKVEEIYAGDALTIPASLAGVCAVSVPIGFVRDDEGIKGKDRMGTCDEGKQSCGKEEVVNGKNRTRGVIVDIENSGNYITNSPEFSNGQFLKISNITNKIVHNKDFKEGKGGCAEGRGIPVGMQIICGKGEDAKMLGIAKRIEE